MSLKLIENKDQKLFFSREIIAVLIFALFACIEMGPTSGIGLFYGFSYVLFGYLNENALSLNQKLFFKGLQLSALPGFYFGYALLVLMEPILGNSNFIETFLLEHKNKKNFVFQREDLLKPITFGGWLTIGFFFTVQSILVLQTGSFVLTGVFTAYGVVSNSGGILNFIVLLSDQTVWKPFLLGLTLLKSRELVNKRYSTFFQKYCSPDCVEVKNYISSTSLGFKFVSFVAPFFPFLGLLNSPRVFLEFNHFNSNSSDFDLILTDINESRESPKSDEIIPFAKPNLPVEKLQQPKTSSFGSQLKNQFFSVKPKLVLDHKSHCKHFVSGITDSSLGGTIDSFDIIQYGEGIREINYTVSGGPITSASYKLQNDEISSCSYTKIVETNPLLNYTNLNGANGILPSDEIFGFIIGNQNAPTSVAGELQLVSQLHQERLARSLEAQALDKLNVKSYSLDENFSMREELKNLHHERLGRNLEAPTLEKPLVKNLTNSKETQMVTLSDLESNASSSVTKNEVNTSSLVNGNGVLIITENVNEEHSVENHLASSKTEEQTLKISKKSNLNPAQKSSTFGLENNFAAIGPTSVFSRNIVSSTESHLVSFEIDCMNFSSALNFFLESLVYSVVNDFSSYFLQQHVNSVNTLLVQFLKFFLTPPTTSQLQYDSFWVDFFRIRALDKIWRSEIGIFSSSHENESFAGQFSSFFAPSQNFSATQLIEESLKFSNLPKDTCVDLLDPLGNSFLKTVILKDGTSVKVRVLNFKALTRNNSNPTSFIVPVVVSENYFKAFNKSPYVPPAGHHICWDIAEFSSLNGVFILNKKLKQDQKFFNGIHPFLGLGEIGKMYNYQQQNPFLFLDSTLASTPKKQKTRISQQTQKISNFSSTLNSNLNSKKVESKKSNDRDKNKMVTTFPFKSKASFPVAGKKQKFNGSCKPAKLNNFNLNELEGGGLVSASIMSSSSQTSGRFYLSGSINPQSLSFRQREIFRRGLEKEHEKNFYEAQESAFKDAFETNLLTFVEWFSGIDSYNTAGSTGSSSSNSVIPDVIENPENSNTRNSGTQTTALNEIIENAQTLSSSITRGKDTFQQNDKGKSNSFLSSCFVCFKGNPSKKKKNILSSEKTILDTVLSTNQNVSQKDVSLEDQAGPSVSSEHRKKIEETEKIEKFASELAKKFRPIFYAKKKGKQKVEETSAKLSPRALALVKSLAGCFSIPNYQTQELQKPKKRFSDNERGNLLAVYGFEAERENHDIIVGMVKGFVRSVSLPILGPGARRSSSAGATSVVPRTRLSSTNSRESGRNFSFTGKNQQAGASHPFQGSLDGSFLLKNRSDSRNNNFSVSRASLRETQLNKVRANLFSYLLSGQIEKAEDYLYIQLVRKRQPVLKNEQIGVELPEQDGFLPEIPEEPQNNLEFSFCKEIFVRKMSKEEQELMFTLFTYVNEKLADFLTESLNYNPTEKESYENLTKKWNDIITDDLIPQVMALEKENKKVVATFLMLRDYNLLKLEILKVIHLKNRLKKEENLTETNYDLTTHEKVIHKLASKAELYEVEKSCKNLSVRQLQKKFRTYFTKMTLENYEKIVSSLVSFHHEDSRFLEEPFVYLKYTFEDGTEIYQRVSQDIDKCHGYSAARGVNNRLESVFNINGSNSTLNIFFMELSNHYVATVFEFGTFKAEALKRIANIINILEENIFHFNAEGLQKKTELEEFFREFDEFSHSPQAFIAENDKNMTKKVQNYLDSSLVIQSNEQKYLAGFLVAFLTLWDELAYKLKSNSLGKEIYIQKFETLNREFELLELQLKKARIGRGAFPTILGRLTQNVEHAYDNQQELINVLASNYGALIKVEIVIKAQK